MWTPLQLKQKEADLKLAGLQIPVDDIFSNDTTSLKDAVVAEHNQNYILLRYERQQRNYLSVRGDMPWCRKKAASTRNNSDSE